MSNLRKDAVLLDRQVVADILELAAAATLTAVQNDVRGDTTSSAFTVTLPAPELAPGRFFTIQANRPGANNLTVAFTGVAPDGSQAIAVDEGYVVAYSTGYIWVVMAKKLS